MHNEDNIKGYLGNDKVRFYSLADTKSTSRIRIDKNLKREPTHLNVVKFLKENFYEDVIDIVCKIIYNITEENIDNILMYYLNLMSNERILLIKKFLITKVGLLKEEFKI